MRLTSIYEVTCDKCGEVVMGPAVELECKCGREFRVEWPCVTKVEAMKVVYVRKGELR